MKKTVLLLCFAAFFASCKTTKFNTRETVKTGIEVRSDTKEDVRIFEETKVTDNITQLTDELVTVLERIIAVKLSDPDSTGVQFPIEITTTDREYSKEKTVRHDASSVMEQKAEGRMEKGESRRERVEIKQNKHVNALKRKIERYEKLLRENNINF